MKRGYERESRGSTLSPLPPAALRAGARKAASAAELSFAARLAETRGFRAEFCALAETLAGAARERPIAVAGPLVIGPLAARGEWALPFTPPAWPLGIGPFATRWEWALPFTPPAKLRSLVVAKRFRAALEPRVGALSAWCAGKGPSLSARAKFAAPGTPISALLLPFALHFV